MSKQIIGSAGQVLAAVEVLCGYAVRGISNVALAHGLNMLPSAVTRIMHTLIEQGWARKDPETGLFFPSAKVIQLSAKAMRDLASAEQKLADARSSFTRDI